MLTTAIVLGLSMLGAPVEFTSSNVVELDVESSIQDSDVSSADLNGDGLRDIVVSRLQHTSFVVFAQPDGTFSAPAILTLDLGGRATIVLHDFDDNGRPDILTGAGKVYFNDGIGGFMTEPVALFATGPAAIGDLNDDGLDDVAVVSGTSLMVYLASGPLAFADPIVHNITVSGFTNTTTDDRVVIARVADTGLPDVFVRNIRITAPTSTVDATIARFGFLSATGTQATEISVSGAANLDSDPADELLVSATVLSTATLRALNFNAGVFTSTGEFHIGFEGPFGALVRDLDNDGDNDLVMSCRRMVDQDFIRSSLQPMFVTALNDGEGHLTVQGLHNAGGEKCCGVVTGRFKSSGCEELIAVTTGMGLITTFTSVIREWTPSLCRFDMCEGVLPVFDPVIVASGLDTGSAPPIIAFSDLNGDGLLDIFGGLRGLFVGRLALAPGRWSTREIPGGTATNSISGVARIDTNQDGELDNIVRTSGGNRVLVLTPNNNNAYYSREVWIANSNPLPSSIRPTYTPQESKADLNHDGVDDVLSTGPGSSATLATVVSQPTDSFAITSYSTNVTNSRIIATAAYDVNGDHWDDAVVCIGTATNSVQEFTPLNGQILVFLNLADGTGALGAPYTLYASPATATPLSMLCEELTGDGIRDLLYTDSTGVMMLWRGTGSGFASPSARDFAPLALNSVIAGDLDGDGDNDLVALVIDQALRSSSVPLFDLFISTRQNPWILLNNGDGGFGTPIDGPRGTGNLDSVLLHDADGDDKLDILLVGSVGPTTVHFNRTPSTPPPACPGDANGDRVVNFADLSVLLSLFNHNVDAGAYADFDHSGHVDGSDLSVLLATFGDDCK